MFLKILQIHGKHLCCSLFFNKAADLKAWSYLSTLILKNTFWWLTAWQVSKYEVFSGPYFPAFGLNTVRYSVPYSVRMRENMDQKKLRIWTLFTQLLLLKEYYRCNGRPSEIEMILQCKIKWLEMSRWKQSCGTARSRWCFFITIIVIIPSFQADKKYQCSCFSNTIIEIPRLKSEVISYFMCDKSLSKKLLGNKKSNKSNDIAIRKILWWLIKIEGILRYDAFCHWLEYSSFQIFIRVEDLYH